MLTVGLAFGGELGVLAEKAVAGVHALDTVGLGIEGGRAGG